MTARAADQSWRTAHSAYQWAGQRALDACRRSLRKGRLVHWEHGQHTRAGRVVEVSSWGYSTARALIASVTGRTYWVHVVTLLDRLAI